VTGFQPMFVVVILGGRALGPGFGFLLGAIAMFASAVLTGGIGPWLPFQMIAAAWLGMGAGMLPPARGRTETGMLVGYGLIAGIGYGFLLNLWFWPFTTGLESALSYEPGAPLSENLSRFLVFCLVTSLGFDIPRAIGNAVLIALLGGPVLRMLRRTAKVAAFDAVAVFDEPVAAVPRR
jgi:energy-coupling factor transport system substrate-specific component